MSEGEGRPQPKWEGPVDADGLPHGRGIMAYPSPPQQEDEGEKPGDQYDGLMEHGKKQGQGKYAWSNGATFHGEYVSNKKHGQGTMVYPDKSRYEGSWVEDRMDGEGTYYYSSGDIYQGNFKDGKKNGSGMYHFKAQNCQFMGIWSQGHFIEGKWVHRDGTTFKGSFDQSIPSQGKFFFTRSGLMQQGTYTKEAGWQGANDATLGTAAVVH